MSAIHIHCIHQEFRKCLQPWQILDTIMRDLDRDPLRASERGCASLGARVLLQRARIAAGRGRSSDLYCCDKLLHSAATGRIPRWEAG